MRRARTLVAATVFSLGTALLAALPAAAGAAAADTVAPASSAAFTPSADAATTTQVTLPTGDSVQVTSSPSGRLGAIVMPATQSGTGGLFYTLSVGGHLYVVPARAMSGLAGQSVPSTFDVASLAGVGSSASPASAAASSTAPASSISPDGRVPGRPPASQRHRYIMRTLTIRATTITGAAPTDVPYVVLNVDNMSTYSYFSSLDSGITKLSVPEGHYCVIGFFTDYNAQTGQYAERIVTDPELTISATSDPLVNLDERQATSQLQVSTPRPATLQTFTATVYRSDSVGNGASFGFTMSGTNSIYVQPARLPSGSPGTLQFTDYFRLAAPDDSYTYDVEFPASGEVPADTDYVVSPDQLATVDTTYKADVTGMTESEQRMSWLPWQAADVQAADPPLVTPIQRTEYITGDPQIDWQQTLTTLISPLITAGQSLDSYRSYRAGEHLTDTWRGSPTHPSVQYDFGANPGDYMLCPACRDGDTMDLAIYPFGDNTPGHVTLRDSLPPFGAGGVHESTSFQVDLNGSPYASTTQAIGSLTVPDAAATYSFSYDSTRTAPWWTLSTSQQTTWTFTSSAADGTGTLPSGWYCDASLDTDCSVIPLLFPYIQLPTDDLGELSPGTVSVPFTVEHLQHSSDSPVTSADLQVSYDGGTTWQDVPAVQDSSGQFTAQLTVPAASQTDGFGALRISASDGAGSSVTQTVLNSFVITGSDAALQAETALAASGTAATSPATGSTDEPVPANDGSGEPASASGAAASPQPACAAIDSPGAHIARCFALVEPLAPAGETAAADAAADGTPAGYGPADLQSAYKLTAASANRGGGQTVAVVDAYNDPDAEADLAVYRAEYGLRPCTTASGCLQIVNQDGVPGALPPDDPDWGLEISLDLDMVSAICPNCSILLVEANSDAVSDLAAAAKTAADLGAVAISNSYGTNEFTGMGAYRADYSQPGHFEAAASGDYGFGVTQFPAVLSTVTAVGGTTLTAAPGTRRGWTETAWGDGALSDVAGGSGSGCSAYVPKPRWQHDPDCFMREVADVSAVADPATGVAVYDSYGYGGWRVVGGTSAATPIIASVAALAGNAQLIGDAWIYRHERDLFDVTSGSNGSCFGDYHCTAVRGYDGPTGLGTPDGTGAF